MERGPPERKRRSESWLETLESVPSVDPVVTLSFAPVAVYLLVDWIADARPAIAASLAAAIAAVLIQRRLRRQVGVVFRLAMLGLAVFIASGIAGLVLDSGKALWASDPIEDFLVGGIFALSVLLRRPILSPLIRELFPQIAARLPPEHRVFMLLTAVWAVKILLMGVLRIWLLDTLEVNTYVWLRTVVGWPINAVLLLWTVQRIQRAMREQSLLAAEAKPGGSGEMVA